MHKLAQLKRASRTSRSRTRNSSAVHRGIVPLAECMHLRSTDLLPGFSEISPPHNTGSCPLRHGFLERFLTFAAFTSPVTPSTVRPRRRLRVRKTACHGVHADAASSAERNYRSCQRTLRLQHHEAVCRARLLGLAVSVASVLVPPCIPLRP